VHWHQAWLAGADMHSQTLREIHNYKQDMNRSTA